MVGRERFVGETESRGRAGCEILHEDVGLAEETRENCTGFTMLDVERQAFLRAIGPDELRREPAHALVVAAREIAAAGTLDLDDARAEVGELARAEWPRDRVLERDDGDAIEREDSGTHIKTIAAVLAHARQC